MTCWFFRIFEKKNNSSRDRRFNRGRIFDFCQNLRQIIDFPMTKWQKTHTSLPHQKNTKLYKTYDKNAVMRYQQESPICLLTISVNTIRCVWASTTPLQCASDMRVPICTILHQNRRPAIAQPREQKYVAIHTPRLKTAPLPLPPPNPTPDIRNQNFCTLEALFLGETWKIYVWTKICF